MILDKDNLFSNEQAITTTANSTNVIDLGAEGAGKGTNLDIVGFVTETFLTNTNLTVTLTTADNEAMSSARTIGTAEVLVRANGDLDAGKEVNFGRVPDNADRYLRLTYTIGGSNATAGKITAGIVAGRK